MGLSNMIHYFKEGEVVIFNGSLKNADCSTTIVMRNLTVGERYRILWVFDHSRLGQRCRISDIYNVSDIKSLKCLFPSQSFTYLYDFYRSKYNLI